MSRVQTCGERMIAEHGFLGVPADTFEQAGRQQFVALLSEGLVPESKVLDIGCGCLRTAYWLIRFLDPGGYHGIEPARRRVDLGLRYLFTPEILESRMPRFDFNPDFDSSVFHARFDYFLAGSIWSHASKRQIGITLDSFVRDTSPGAVFLASYIPAQSPGEDYEGDRWIGTSHESDTAGVIRHLFSWIEGQCRSRHLQAEELSGEAFDGQTWIRVRRK